MNPPFTADQFLEVFRRYHESVGPAPIALTALGLFIAASAYRADLWRSWPWAQTALVLLFAAVAALVVIHHERHHQGMRQVDSTLRV